MANPLQQLLSAGGAGIQMPNVARSAMVEQLLAQAVRQPIQAKSPIEGINIASKQILAALLARRESQAQNQQSEAARQALAQALGVSNLGQVNSQGVRGAGIAPQPGGVRAPGAGVPAGQGGGSREQQMLAALVSGMDPQGVQGATQFMMQQALTPPPQQNRTRPLTNSEKESVGIPVESFAQVDQDGKVSIDDPPNALVDVNIDQREGFGALPDSLQALVIESTGKAETAQRQMQEMAVMQEMAEGADTGLLTPVTLPIKEAFQAIGVTLDEDVPLLESLRSQQNQLALRLRNPDSGFGLTGSTSDRDLRFLRDAVPGIANTPMGNQAIATIMVAKSRRDALIENAKADYILENRGLQGWSTARQELVDSTPFFNETEQTLIESLSAPGSELPGFDELTPEEQQELIQLEQRTNASRIR